MDISETHRPTLPHLSAVLLALRYKPTPIKLLELGLGGGSMQRFFHHYFPHSDIISIENNPNVLTLFETWFSVADESHSVLLGDAEQDIHHYQQQDLIFVDLFSKSGSPDFVSTLPFYQNCLSALHDDGLLVINLIAQYQLQMELTLDLLRQLNLNLRTFAIPGYQNKIIFAARQELPAIDYDKALNDLAQTYQLDLNAVVAMM